MIAEQRPGSGFMFVCFLNDFVLGTHFMVTAAYSNTSLAVSHTVNVSN
jgi:hypothetical protein